MGIGSLLAQLVRALGFTIAARVAIAVAEHYDRSPVPWITAQVVSAVDSGAGEWVAWGLAAVFGIAISVLWDWFGLGNRLAARLPQRRISSGLKAVGALMREGGSLHAELPIGEAPYAAWKVRVDDWVERAAAEVSESFGSHESDQFMVLRPAAPAGPIVGGSEAHARERHFLGGRIDVLRDLIKRFSR